MLTDTGLRKLRPLEKSFKVADRDGMYVTVSVTGTKSFRYDYRLNGRRETLTIGKYDDTAGAKHPREPEALEFGMTVSLAEARTLLSVARRLVERGESPSRSKAERRQDAADALTFGRWAERYFEDKSDPKNGARLADSTLAMRRSVYKRYLEGPFGKLKLDEIKPAMLMKHCESVKDKGAAAPAVQVREIVLLVYRFAASKDKSVVVVNPADGIRPSDIATFKARDRALSPIEIRQFLAALETTATAPTLRLALRFVMLTMVRKGEFVNATWDEVDFDNATWTIPKERMKTGKPHVVYLSNQALDILVTFKTCFSASRFLHPGRYDMDTPISNATLNRVVEVGIAAVRSRGDEFASFNLQELSRNYSMVMSAGEVSALSRMRSAGLTVQEGQMARLPSLKVNSKHGLWDNVRGYESGAEKSKAIASLLNECYGHAGAALCAHLVEQLPHLHTEYSKLAPELRDHLTEGLTFNQTDGVSDRMRENFVLFAFAGLMAVDAQAVGWSKEQVMKAIARSFAQWHADYQQSLPISEEAVMKHLRLFFQSQRGDKFKPFQQFNEQHKGTVAGYEYRGRSNKEALFLVYPSYLENVVCKGLDLQIALKALREQHLLVPGARGVPTKQFHAPGSENRSASFYAIKQAILLA
ncbi:hypothetical protein ACDW_28810 [Acidovorax sp. DW039]|uniref:integrase arm-type DNA-binding domain-containing protein n=1 Tax=Acidovorax sp. DW039 TaxID=3095606 RepID=UPI00308E9ACD|nr:hypothetical protein ACDW_28810 [Acidovorax sp. DW039]